MANPEISIIIPVYNVELYLPQCIDSVLSQTYKDFELILIDDGSTDGSPKICNKYADKDTRVRVTHQENAGVSAARNAGIQMAQGEWISFVDSDDWVEPLYLQNFKIENVDAEVITQGLQYVNHTTGKILELKEFNDAVIISKSHQELIVDNDLLMQGYPVCKAYRKDFLDKNNLHFDISLSTHEDILFVLQCFTAASQIVIRSGTFYNYRYYHSGNTLSSKVHPWRETLDSSVKMYDAMKFAVLHFDIRDPNYIKYVYSRSLAPRIKALFDLQFDNIYNYKQNISYILSERNDIVNFYIAPKSFIYDIMIFLIREEKDWALCLFLYVYKKIKLIWK